MSDRTLYKYTAESYDLWLILNWRVPWKKNLGLTCSFILAFIWRNLKSKENLSVYPVSQPRLLLFVLSSLVTSLFFPVLLLNHQWSPTPKLEASHFSTFRIMRDVPSIAVFCSESIECFPGTASKFFLKLLIIIIIIIIIIITRYGCLCHRHFFPVLLLNQRWSPPLRLQASHCSTFRIMCDVPSIAVFCCESV